MIGIKTFFEKSTESSYISQNFIASMKPTGFKLLAIKPLANCNKDYLKVLRPGELYRFYNHYKIIAHEDYSEEVVINEDFPPEIFNVGEIRVEISAIVGKNGTGKSSLVELLYVALYNIAFRLNLITKLDEDTKREHQYESDIHVAIYYTIRDKFYRLTVDGENIWLARFQDMKCKDVYNERFKSKEQLRLLFYSIVINYSQYGLNTEDLGFWIKGIFHKNDAYQTPIVLNPYRKKGIIDINTETELARSRLLANILEGSAKSLWFNNNEKVPRKLIFKIVERKFEPDEELRKSLIENWKIYWDEFLPAFQEHFPGIDGRAELNLPLDICAKKYLILKLESISRKYISYHDFKDFYKDGNNDTRRNFIKTLKKDLSHIAFKFKQAVNFLRFNTLPEMFSALPGNEEFSIEVDELVSAIKKVRRKYTATRIIELIPPSFLHPDIEFDNPEDRFKKLSSGEKQKIYALSSLVYHLRNLASVKKRVTPRLVKRPIIKYEYINIIFDEVELYYHPDLQRRFIKDMLDNISAANLTQIKAINLLFITHSPFLLSDIPASNILYLDVHQHQTVISGSSGETFGGNIHDLLANSFFLDKEGYMGEYAKETIKSGLEFLLPDPKKGTEKPAVEIKWDKEKIRGLLDMIGEPLIKRSMNELYINKYLPTVSEIDNEIERLQKLKKTKAENKQNP
ncbi:AAA family ATPase [Mucilaginibacter sp.]|uniref:AAA family ATPase n=1 Tax=Mucilaginibacter sp. TaxID=1882438 RepID=UPI003D0DFCA7